MSAVYSALFENCDLTVAPLVPCLFCGQDTPLTVFVLHAYVDGRALGYCTCPTCLGTNGGARNGAINSSEARRRYFARVDRLLRKHLRDRVLPVARALTANVEALIRKQRRAA